MPPFSFLNFSFLIYLPLAAAPLLIHLISRKKRQVVEFPSLKFLKTAYLKRIKYVRLNELLLMAVRILILTLMVLAFSRFCFFFDDANPAVGLKYAIIIDNSYSAEYISGGKTLMTRAKDEAAKLCAGLKPDPEFIIIEGNDPAGNDKFLNAGVAAERIGKIRAATAPFSLSRALAVLSEKENYRQISKVFVISDFLTSDKAAAQELESVLNSNKTLKNGAEISLIKTSPENLNELKTTKNFSIQSVALSDERIIAGKPFFIRGKVKNHSVYPGTIEISLLQDESAAEKIAVFVEAQAESEFAIAHTLFNAGQYSMKLTLGDDAIINDNTYNFTVTPVSALYVLILYAGDERKLETPEYKFISAALNPLNSISLKDGLVIQPVAVNINTQQPGEFNNYDAVVIAGVESLGEADRQKLNQYANSGGGVFFIPPKDGNLKKFSDTFAGIIPAAFNESSSVISSLKEGSGFSITNADLEHPVFSVFKTSGSGDISAPVFYRAIPVEDRQFNSLDTKVIARFDGTIPALIERKVGRGKSVMFMAYADSLSSSFTQSPLFVPFIHQVIFYLNRQNVQSGRPIVIGTPIVISFHAEDMVSNVTCQPPYKGSERKMDIKAGPDGLSASFYQTDIPGFYTIFKKSDEKITVEKIPVNFKPQESLTENSDYDAVLKVLTSYGMKQEKNEAGGAPVKKRSEITPYLFALILSLFLAENFLIYKLKQ